MSTGMRKWMEKDCPEIEYPPAQVLIDREEFTQLRAELDKYKTERDALRAKVEAMVRQEPVAWARKLGLDVPSFGCVTDLKYRPSNIPESSYIPLYALPGAQTQPAPSVPSVEAAEAMGEKGGPVVEAERIAFEAWMRGHCWNLCAEWTGTQYLSAFEKDGMVDTRAMRTREIWAAWRDRAALAAAPEAKP